MHVCACACVTRAHAHTHACILILLVWVWVDRGVCRGVGAHIRISKGAKGVLQMKHFLQQYVRHVYDLGPTH